MDFHGHFITARSVIMSVIIVSKARIKSIVITSSVLLLLTLLQIYDIVQSYHIKKFKSGTFVSKIRRENHWKLIIISLLTKSLLIQRIPTIWCSRLSKDTSVMLQLKKKKPIS
jgi:hypothetical protein